VLRLSTLMVKQIIVMVSINSCMVAARQRILMSDTRLAVGRLIQTLENSGSHKVAEVLCGGNITPGTPTGEQYMLDLEREAFKSLCGERQTQQRIQYTLKTGKTLRT
jgi:hypothetical protein